PSGYPVMKILLAEEFHDIAPPVDYSLIPQWLVFSGIIGAIALIGVAIWLFLRSRKSVLPVKSPRERALEHLELMEHEVDKIRPYQFSIRVSGVLRQYVTEEFHLPVTRQTSV